MLANQVSHESGVKSTSHPCDTLSQATQEKHAAQGLTKKLNICIIDGRRGRKHKLSVTRVTDNFSRRKESEKIGV